eukprot:scaffold1620_cov148-Amphora_coffeaeformis.AAC.3
MAARKSCTHMTWAEAKNKSGLGSSKGQKKSKVLKGQDHATALAAKIIAKQGGGVAEAEKRKLQKAYRKQEEKAAALAAKREEERELKRLEALQEVQRYEQATEKFRELMEQLREKEMNEMPTLDLSEIDLEDEGTQLKIVECRQMQLDEILALEAMIPEEDFVISLDSRLSELREKLEQLAENEENGDVRSSIAKHPPISYYIRIEVDDYRDKVDEDDDDQPVQDLNAMALLRVTLPPLYLNADGSQLPLWEFAHVMVTDKTEMCSADKPLESLAWLDLPRIQQDMSAKAREELLPYPAVYETAVTWLSENIFDYLNLHPHLLATSATTKK